MKYTQIKTTPQPPIGSGFAAATTAADSLQ